MVLNVVASALATIACGLAGPPKTHMLLFFVYEAVQGPPSTCFLCVAMLGHPKKVFL